jgi:serine/threonine protein kinase
MATVWGNRWTCITSVGEGGQAHTFRVRDKDGSESWILKRLKNDQRLGRFEQEIRALIKISSSRIPQIVDFQTDDPAYLVYRDLGPTTLEKVVKQENPSFDEIFDLFRDVVEAITDAHRAGVAHRDIKPNNVIISGDTAKQRASLIDFGICQFIDGDVFNTTVDEPLGNRSFAAPELEAGTNIDPGPKSDIYGLGKLLYWSITGGRFIARENLTDEVMSWIPEPRGVERAHVERILRSDLQFMQIPITGLTQNRYLSKWRMLASRYAWV